MKRLFGNTEIKRLLSTAGRYADVEVTRIKNETANNLAAIRERHAANRTYRSSMFVRAVRDVLEGESKERGEAAWQVLHDILDSSPRHYYRKLEIEEVQNWARGRFDGVADGLLETLIQEASRPGRADSGIFDRTKEELETSVAKAQDRLEAEVEKYFCTRRNWIRWLMELTQHPVVSHLVIGVMGFIAALLFQRCG